MAEMSNYCKAYLADELRRFPGWCEMAPPLVVRKEQGKDTENPGTSFPKDEEAHYFFVQEDFTVTAGIFRDQNIAFDQITDAWKEFCARVLQFQPPNPEPAS